MKGGDCWAFSMFHSMTLCPQCSRPRLEPWSGNWIPYAANKSSQAATKEPTAAVKTADPTGHN